MIARARALCAALLACALAVACIAPAAFATSDVASSAAPSGWQAANGKWYRIDENGVAYRPLRMQISTVDELVGEGYDTAHSDYWLDGTAFTRVSEAVDAVEATGAHVGFVMIDVQTGETVSYNCDEAVYSASSIKGPYVAALCRARGDSLSAGIQDLMSAAVVYSSNDAYHALLRSYRWADFIDFCDYLGGVDFYIGRNWPVYSARDFSKLWLGCYDYFFVHTNEMSQWCREQFTQPNYSFINAALQEQCTVYSKAGWIGENRYMSLSEGAIVMSDDGPYIMAIVSTAIGRDAQMQELALALDAAHSAMVS